MFIGINIKKYRKLKKMTQKELADEVGVEVKSIGRYERGETKPTVEIIEKISRALGVPKNDLMLESFSSALINFIVTYLKEGFATIYNKGEYKSEDIYDFLNNISNSTGINIESLKLSLDQGIELSNKDQTILINYLYQFDKNALSDLQFLTVLGECDIKCDIDQYIDRLLSEDEAKKERVLETRTLPELDTTKNIEEEISFYIKDKLKDNNLSDEDLENTLQNITNFLNYEIYKLKEKRDTNKS